MPDVQVGMWLPAHLLDALRSGRGLWWAPDLLWPTGQDVALLVWNLLLAALMLPLYALLEPLVAYNLAVLAFSGANAAAAWALGRQLGGAAGGLVAAALVLCSPYAWNELLQGRCEQGVLAGLLLTCAGLLALERAPDTRRAVGVGLLWALTALAYWFYGYFLLLVVIGLSVAALAGRRWARLRALVVASAVSAAAAGPLAAALLWQAVSPGSSFSRSQDGTLQAALHTLAQGASLTVQSTIWPLHPPEQLRDVLPLVSLVSLLAWPWVRQQARFLGPMAAACLALAYGRQLQQAPGELLMLGESALSLPFAWLQSALPGFGRLWWPYRFLSLFVVGAAGCAAALVGRLPGRGLRWGAALVLALGALVELRVATQLSDSRLYFDAPVAFERSRLFDTLAEEPGAHPLLYLPFRGFGTGRALWQPYHQQPTSMGLGDSADHLLPAAVQAETESDVVLVYLKELGQAAPHQRPPPPPRPVRPALQARGYHYAVLWQLAPETVETYTRLLGPPDYTDAVIVAWDLR